MVHHHAPGTALALTDAKVDLAGDRGLGDRSAIFTIKIDSR